MSWISSYCHHKRHAKTSLSRDTKTVLTPKMSINISSSSQEENLCADHSLAWCSRFRRQRTIGLSCEEASLTLLTASSRHLLSSQATWRTCSNPTKHGRLTPRVRSLTIGKRLLLSVPQSLTTMQLLNWPFILPLRRNLTTSKSGELLKMQPLRTFIFTSWSTHVSCSGLLHNLSQNIHLRDSTICSQTLPLRRLTQVL